MIVLIFTAPHTLIGDGEGDLDVIGKRPSAVGGPRGGDPNPSAAAREHKSLVRSDSYLGLCHVYSMICGMVMKISG